MVRLLVNIFFIVSLTGNRNDMTCEINPSIALGFPLLWVKRTNEIQNEKNTPHTIGNNFLFRDKSSGGKNYFGYQFYRFDR